MPCEPIVFRDTEGNVTATGIVCSRGRRSRPKCKVCQGLARDRDSAYQCDGANPRHKSKTCDMHLCSEHASCVGPDQHLCPTCLANEVARRAPERPVNSVAAPGQSLGARLDPALRKASPRVGIRLSVKPIEPHGQLSLFRSGSEVHSSDVSGLRRR